MDRAPTTYHLRTPTVSGEACGNLGFANLGHGLSMAAFLLVAIKWTMIVSYWDSLEMMLLCSLKKSVIRTDLTSLLEIEVDADMLARRNSRYS